MKRKCTGYVLAAGIAVSGAIVAVPGHAWAQTTIYVATDGNDQQGCGAETSPCATLYRANLEANQGPADTISVAAGTYEMDHEVSITKQGLTVKGAKYGQDARQRTPDGQGETIITGSTPVADRAFIWAQGDGVTIDGFDFEGNTSGAGATTDAFTHSGYDVSHDIFHGNTTGLLAHSDGATPSVFTQNLYADNNSGPGSGEGILAYDPLANASFTDSTFEGNDSASLYLSGGEVGGATNNITIANNVMTDDGGVDLGVVSNAQVTGNQMNGGELGVSVSIDSHNVDITHNTITDKEDGGIIVPTNGFPQFPDSGITITQNTILRSGGPGIEVDSSAYDGPMEVRYNRIVDSGEHIGLVDDAANAQIDARWNWWGCNDMPSGDGCDHPAGTEDTNVQFDPWLEMTIASQPSDLASTQQATITTTLNTDSGGQAQTGPFFDPPPVTFSASTGTIAPLDTTTDAALLATATWTAGQGQAGEVCAKIDNQELCLPVAEAPPVQPPVIPPVQPPVIPPVQPPVSPPARPSTPPKVSVRVAPVVKVRISPELRVPVTG